MIMQNLGLYKLGPFLEGACHLLNKWAPRSITDQIIRNSIHLPKILHEDLIVKVADTLDELEQAQELTYNQYQEVGAISANEAHQYISAFHLLPTTQTIVVKIKGEVVATMTLINHSVLGLPCEDILANGLDDNEYITNYAEGFFYACKADWTEFAVWPMLKYMYELSRRVYNIDKLYIPTQEGSLLGPFLEALFFAQKETLVRDPIYSFVKPNLKMNIYSLDFAKVHMKLIKTYWNQPSQQDLFNYLHNIEFANMEFPAELERKLSVSVLNELIKENPDIFSNLSNFQKYCLHQVYAESNYQELLPVYDEEIINLTDRRKLSDRRKESRSTPDRRIMFHNRELRFESNFKALVNDDGTDLNSVVTNVSLNGLRIQCDRPLKLGKSYKIQLSINEHEYIDIDVRTIWAKKDLGSYGLRLERSTNKDWSKVIHHVIDTHQAS